MGWTGPSQHIHAKRPTANLVSRKVLFPMIGQMLIQIIYQAFVFLDVRRFPWYTKPSTNPSEANIKNYENTSLFLFANFQYITIAVVFSAGYPYRKSILTNRKLNVTLIRLIRLRSFDDFPRTIDLNMSLFHRFPGSIHGVGSRVDGSSSRTSHTSSGLCLSQLHHFNSVC